MPRRSKLSSPGAAGSRRPAEEGDIVQLKVRLLGISPMCRATPMIWRRLLVPSTCTLAELHGIICRLVADIGMVKEISRQYSTNTNTAER